MDLDVFYDVTHDTFRISILNKPRYSDYVEPDRGLHNHRCAQPPPDIQGPGYH